MPETDNGNELQELLRVMLSTTELIARQLAWAEDEIEAATDRHPAERDLLYHGHALLTPRFTAMTTEFVYRSHCRELLERLATGADTRPATAAEICCLCSDISLRVPFNTTAAGLYIRTWSAAFPDKPLENDNRAHYEALKGAEIDDLEAFVRRKLADSSRMLRNVSCTGRHAGEPTQCKFAGQNSH